MGVVDIAEGMGLIQYLMPETRAHIHWSSLWCSAFSSRRLDVLQAVYRAERAFGWANGETTWRGRRAANLVEDGTWSAICDRYG